MQNQIIKSTTMTLHSTRQLISLIKIQNGFRERERREDDLKLHSFSSDFRAIRRNSARASFFMDNLICTRSSRERKETYAAQAHLCPSVFSSVDSFHYRVERTGTLFEEDMGRPSVRNRGLPVVQPLLFPHGVTFSLLADKDARFLTRRFKKRPSYEQPR